jgi:hypothetical protein
MVSNSSSLLNHQPMIFHKFPSTNQLKTHGDSSSGVDGNSWKFMVSWGFHEDSWDL